MESQSHTYIAMDLKSFYASVECVDRGLDPLNTNPGGSGCLPDAEDHLPGGISLSEILWNPGTGKTVRSDLQSKRSKCHAESAVPWRQIFGKKHLCG